MKKALITGVDGFTGRYMARELTAQGIEVYGVARKALPRETPNVFVCHQADLLDASRLREIVALVRPDFVVHLAAIAFVAHTNVEAIYQTNVLGTRCLLQALVDEQCQPQAVLVASSANVYGNSAFGVLSESAPVNPANDYAVSKVATEYVARLYAEKLPLIIVRPFNYTGFGQSLQFLIPKIVDHFVRRAPILEAGNLDVARDFSDVRTVVAQYAQLLNCPGAIGEILNICSGHATSLLEVVDRVSALSQHTLEIRVNPAFVRQNEVKALCGDHAKLLGLLGEVPGVSLDETLAWMLTNNPSCH